MLSVVGKEKKTVARAPRLVSSHRRHTRRRLFVSAVPRSIYRLITISVTGRSRRGHGNYTRTSCIYMYIDNIK